MASILIIDDSPTEVQTLTNILEPAGYDVYTAESGEEGVQEAKSLTPKDSSPKGLAPLKPDLILMDVVMPGMSGFQATRSLSKDPKTCNIPIIIVSTKDQQTDRMWGMRQGAKAYLVKPVNPAELLSAVEKALLAST